MGRARQVWHFGSAPKRPEVQAFCSALGSAAQPPIAPRRKEPRGPAPEGRARGSGCGGEPSSAHVQRPRERPLCRRCLGPVRPLRSVSVPARRRSPASSRLPTPRPRMWRSGRSGTLLLTLRGRRGRRRGAAGGSRPGKWPRWDCPSPQLTVRPGLGAERDRAGLRCGRPRSSGVPRGRLLSRAAQQGAAQAPSSSGSEALVGAGTCRGRRRRNPSEAVPAAWRSRPGFSEEREGAVLRPTERRGPCQAQGGGGGLEAGAEGELGNALTSPGAWKSLWLWLGGTEIEGSGLAGGCVDVYAS